MYFDCVTMWYISRCKQLLTGMSWQITVPKPSWEWKIGGVILSVMMAYIAMDLASVSIQQFSCDSMESWVILESSWCHIHVDGLVWIGKMAINHICNLVKHSKELWIVY